MKFIELLENIELNQILKTNIQQRLTYFFNEQKDNIYIQNLILFSKDILHDLNYREICYDMSDIEVENRIKQIFLQIYNHNLPELVNGFEAMKNINKVEQSYNHSLQAKNPINDTNVDNLTRINDNISYSILQFKESKTKILNIIKEDLAKTFFAEMEQLTQKYY